MSLLRLENRRFLPQELTDIVIDYLHDDTSSLQACSVVCRSWLPSSHWHLFYKIRVRLDQFSDETFISALRSSNTMPTSIHMLYVLPPSPGITETTIPHALAKCVLDCLPALHSITLRVAIANAHESEEPQLRWNHSHIRRLHFVNAACPP